MLHRSNHVTTFVTYVCSITNIVLFFLAASGPLRAQMEGSSRFESRFFFDPSPTAVQPPESASPPSAPTRSDRNAESPGAHPVPSSVHSLISSPAQAAPAPVPESSSAIQTPEESAPSRIAPTNSERNAGSQGPHPGPSSTQSLISSPARAAPAPAPARKQEGNRVSSPKPVSQRPIGVGRAAWYEHPGRTASGEKFDPDRLTAAHKTLSFGTRLRVVNMKNGRAVVVRVNDRIPLKTKHITIDLSRASARVVGISGVGRVALYQLDGTERSERAGPSQR